MSIRVKLDRNFLTDSQLLFFSFAFFSGYTPCLHETCQSSGSRKIFAELKVPGMQSTVDGPPKVRYILLLLLLESEFSGVELVFARNAFRSG